MTAFGLQRADERQFKFFRAREELPIATGVSIFGQPQRAALFDGFNCHLLPFLAFVGCRLGIADALRTRSVSSGTMRLRTLVQRIFG